MCDNCEHVESRLMRLLTILFTVSLIIFSAAIITLGILSVSVYWDFLQVIRSSLGSVPYLLIAMGFILLAISILGFVGSVKKHWVLLVTYAVLLGPMMFVEIGSAISCGVFRSQMNATASFGLKNLVMANSTAMDTIQSRLSCCGIYGSKDYSGPLPNSCCATTSRCTEANASPTGCLPAFVDWSVANLMCAVGILMGAIAVEGLSIIVVARLYHLLKLQEKPA